MLDCAKSPSFIADGVPTKAPLWSYHLVINPSSEPPVPVCANKAVSSQYSPLNPISASALSELLLTLIQLPEYVLDSFLKL